MQSLTTSLAVVCLLLTACERESFHAPVTIIPAYSRAELNLLVESHLQATDEVFDWNQATDEVVWSALSLSEFKSVLGYQPMGFRGLNDHIHEIDITSGDWLQTRNELVSDLLASTQQHTGESIAESELFVAPEDGVLPILEVKILHPEVLREFRRRSDVRYLEPSNYTAAEVQLRSGSGCSEAPADVIAEGDVTTISPGAKVPWNYDYMNIQQAWTRTQGDNIGICIIDSGTYPEQSELNGSFGVGRNLSRLGVYQPSWWSSRTDGPDDRCGHGTQMAGLIAAPRTGSGSTVGVAYKSDLTAIRATSDVIINGSTEKRGVKNALVFAGRDAGTQIVSMSIGDVFSSGTVKDGIYYAHNRGKLIFCAAGTSLTWTSWYGVIFPANMSETIAVTGIRSGYPLERCTSCHDGQRVDFVAVMQRRNNANSTSLTLSRRGAQPGYVGGSSAATATTAGIAALVWATNPGQDREQVLQRMKEAASIYPGRDNNFGWGMVDADAATRSVVE